MEEYESEDEGVKIGIGRLKRKAVRDSSWSSSDEDACEEEEEEVTPKVFFSSRTHSQLSQFVKEFKRTGFAPELNVICLGSRKNLCNNSDVLKLGNTIQMNERCLEFQKNQKDAKVKVLSGKGGTRWTKATSGCPMFRKQKLQHLFKNEVQNKGAMDIEDLVQLGSKIGTCPYYGARSMVPSSDIVVLPYQSLLLRAARESLGLNLRKSIIIDEAHNLADCLTNMYNAKITQTQVSGYGTKLASMQSDSIDSDIHGNHAEGSILSCFQALVDIIISLVNHDSDGRILLSRLKLADQREERQIKFVMLSGETIFSEILDQAYAVILAGGTLQPIEETRVRLFPGLSLAQVHFYTCNHIVPPESILPIAVSRGPSGINFDFSYSSRNSLNMIEELGRLLCNLVATVPEGIVVFFSSFEYEGQVYDTWKASGLLSKILKRKTVYREPRSSNDVDLVLKKYKETAACCDGTLKDSAINGAVLLAVVGGKISEGINLSDGMGRCVIMVGLPYPSPDVELIEE